MYKILLPIILLTANSFSQSGCTDALANNFDELATTNDGSCLYDSANVTPSSSTDLPSVLNETSGILYWDNEYWSHNDSGSDINIYSVSSPYSSISKTIPLTNETNTDWEAIEQDNNYLYLGDFGNNNNGNRTDLKILKIHKNTLSENSYDIDYINFSYKNQTDFTPATGNTTDFDCEAFIVDGDKIYLFSKEWTSGNTTIYEAVNETGIQEVEAIDSHNINGLVTDAIYLKEQRIITLIGYTNGTFQPFIYLLYDFQGNDFFGGNKRFITLNLPFHQVEAITTTDGLNYILTNEEVNKSPLIIPARIHELDLSIYLEDYINNQSLNTIEQNINKASVFPNPSNETIRITGIKTNSDYTISNTTGQTLQSGKLNTDNIINIGNLPSGINFLKFNNTKDIYKIIKE